MGKRKGKERKIGLLVQSVVVIKRSGIAARLLGSPGPGYFNTDGGRPPPTWLRRGEMLVTMCACTYIYIYVYIYIYIHIYICRCYIFICTSPYAPHSRARPTRQHIRDIYGFTHPWALKRKKEREGKKERERERYDRWHGSALRYSGFLHEGKSVMGRERICCLCFNTYGGGKLRQNGKAVVEGECRDARGTVMGTSNRTVDRRLSVSPPSRRVEGNGRGLCHTSIGRRARQG